MNAKDFYLAVGGIDEDLIMGAHEQPSRKKLSNIRVWAVAAACICLVCFGVIHSFYGTSVVWNEANGITALSKLSAPADSVLQVIAKEDFKKYFRLDDLPESIGGELCLTPTSFILCVDEAGNPVYDRNQICYQNVEKHQSVCITLSRVTQGAQPQQDAKKSRIHGTPVWLTAAETDSDTAMFTAQWEKDGTAFFVTAIGLDKVFFLSVVEELLN
ncbi:MAG: hypothetical protein HDT33_00460 [Clostridiales bacterium]|nr:hypothetical protein [Clostridiales bacterium]